jgi:hypothetical protein
MGFSWHTGGRAWLEKLSFGLFSIQIVLKRKSRVTKPAFSNYENLTHEKIIV